MPPRIFLLRISLPLYSFLILPAQAKTACIATDQAIKHVGETKCVSGTVVSVRQGGNGENYLEFCPGASHCPFSAVIFPEDLKHIGDVRQLRGKFVEVHGEIKDYENWAQIVVSEPWQLKGEASSIPPLPKSYNVEKKGHYSAGILTHPKTYSTSKKRQPVNLPVSIDDPTD